MRKRSITPEEVVVVKAWIKENKALLKQLNNQTHAYEHYYQVGKHLPEISAATFRLLMVEQGIRVVFNEGPRRYCTYGVWMRGMENRIKKLENRTSRVDSRLA